MRRSSKRAGSVLRAARSACAQTLPPTAILCSARALGRYAANTEKYGPSAGRYHFRHVAECHVEADGCGQAIKRTSRTLPMTGQGSPPSRHACSSRLARRSRGAPPRRVSVFRFVFRPRAQSASTQLLREPAVATLPPRGATAAMSIAGKCAMPRREGARPRGRRGLRHRDEALRHRDEAPIRANEGPRHGDEPLRHHDEAPRRRDEPAIRANKAVIRADEGPCHGDEGPRHHDEASGHRWTAAPRARPPPRRGGGGSQNSSVNPNVQYVPPTRSGSF
jgi:hypothetical protein